MQTEIDFCDLTHLEGLGGAAQCGKILAYHVQCPGLDPQH
jgi:hypothetical protein